jgi:dTDP-4-amino-4,6-dideoxygalactose transaminase
MATYTTQENKQVPAPEVLNAPRATSSGKTSFPFLDLKAQYAAIREEIMAALARVMEGQQLILGPDVRVFEEEVAAYVGAALGIGCASGSDALLLALLAAGVGPGDEVITTPFTFVATAGSVARTGAKPVFVDIDPESYNIAPHLIENALTERTRAIIPVHLFGLAADLDPILKIAGEHNLAVIEDAAQAIGAEYNGNRVGSQGTFGCFSFFPSKNLGGAGDGGMVTTSDPVLAERLRILRVHGSKRKYYYESLGTNSRLDTLQAAVLRVKLAHLDEWTKGRRQNAESYRGLFAEYGLESRVTLPSAPANCFHVFNQFVIRSAERDRLRDFLRLQGIPSEIYYPMPLHLQTAFAYLGYRTGQFPEAEAASQEVLALPIYPELKPEHQRAVVQAIAEFYGTAN